MRRINIKPIRGLLLGALLIGLTGCSGKDTEPPASGAPASEALIDSAVFRTAADSLPDWANHVQRKSGYLYMIGTGRSSSPEIAQKKAVLNARVQLAEQQFPGFPPDSLHKEVLGVIRAVHREQCNDVWDVKVLLESPLSLQTEPRQSSTRDAGRSGFTKQKLILHHGTPIV
ncbi:MAG: hypothetical protein U5R06_14735 [candidate division KSB1 bacterium]|nr:hypothetical protein [candidate division KSB1 bacterium]